MRQTGAECELYATDVHQSTRPPATDPSRDQIGATPCSPTFGWHLARNETKKKAFLIGTGIPALRFANNDICATRQSHMQSKATARKGLAHCERLQGAAL